MKRLPKDNLVSQKPVRFYHRREKKILQFRTACRFKPTKVKYQEVSLTNARYQITLVDRGLRKKVLENSFETTGQRSIQLLRSP